MLRLALLGAGSHCEHVHGPSLALYAREHPGQIELAAVCDLRADRAQLFREKFGFARAYTDLDHMLDREQPDACWVVVPIELTRELAGRVMERGIPTFFEKPPGANLREAEELAQIASRMGTPNMVAFNRRWAPCTRQALEWAQQRGPFEYLYARMLRTQRMDERFAFGTGIHLLDCVRALAEGAGLQLSAAHTARAESAAGALDFHVDLTFGSAGRGRCDILPTCGLLEESYTLFGRTCSIISTLPWVAWPEVRVDGRAELWVEGKLVDSRTWPAEPIHVSSGFYGEACEFISALQQGRRPSPSPQQAVASVALAEAVQEGRPLTLR
jgi:predicted dehydrogenase